MGTDKFSLEGKVALITGSGRSIALCMAQSGADIVCTARTVLYIDIHCESPAL
jgi:NAD(P)-dependent dehydrogenase (short-subunit alcohol dehydrogenase family)